MTWIPYKYHTRVPNPPQIVIISVTDAAYRQRGIQQQNASVYCYACRYPNYRYIHFDSNEYYLCARLENIVFVKPCIVLTYMLSNPDVEWILLLDADIGVVNLTRPIEHYLPSDDEEDIHAIFYERFNGEIQSAGYLIRNHPWSHGFLARWLEWIPRTWNFTTGKGDNGALHIHLLDTVEGVSLDKRNECWRAYQKVSLFNNTYHNYVGCVKCALEGRWQFKHVRILRRGHGFARDPILGAILIPDHDLFIHGDKDNMTAFYKAPIDTNQCCKDRQWQLPIPEELFLHDAIDVRQQIIGVDQAIALELSMTVGVADISSCWPHCTSKLNEYWRRQFLDKVCRVAAWRNN